MSHQSELIGQDIDAYLEQHRTKEMLRVLTCGSVDDGKSTLIGRLLHDSKLIYEDQLAAVERDSDKHGTTEGAPDLALLVDGLKAEREQGITIDVAYRYFSTSRRKFIIADCPGHEQYTRNMATGASSCDLAVILIDARKGVLAQTKRHSFIVSLLGIRHVVVAINKMDLVDYDQDVFTSIQSAYRDFASRLNLGDVRFIPLSALRGDNVVDPSERLAWYQGGTLMSLLEDIHIASDRNLIDLRFPVQSVMRPHLDFRGYCGTLASGVMRVGDEVAVLPSGKRTTIARIVTHDGDLDEAFAPMAVTVTLDDEVDVSRGDMLVHPNNQPRMDHDIEAMVVWMAEAPMTVGKDYWLKQTSHMVGAKVSTLRYAVDVNTVHRTPQATLELNQIGRCSITASQPLFFDAYDRNRGTGAFILVDRLSNRTVAAGMILERGGERRSGWDAETADTLRGEHSRVTAQERSARLDQQAATILFTGLSASGKTSLAYAVERLLFDEGRAVTVLAGQNLRMGLSKDLGFHANDRSENLRRFAEVANLFNRAGIIVLGAFVAPKDEVRRRVAESIGAERFSLVHVHCPVDVCRERDQSGMYARADAGELLDFPGVTSDYEAPTDPTWVVRTTEESVEEGAQRVVAMLRERGIIR